MGHYSSVDFWIQKIIIELHLKLLEPKTMSLKEVFLHRKSVIYPPSHWNRRCPLPEYPQLSVGEFIKPVVRRIPQICRWHHPYGRKWRRTKELLDESENGEWKGCLNTQHSEDKDHGIRSHHFMQIERETMETVTDLIFLGSKITADGDCSHENKRPLPFGRKAMANLDSILKSRHYFANRNPSNQSHGFSSSHV